MAQSRRQVPSQLLGCGVNYNAVFRTLPALMTDFPSTTIHSSMGVEWAPHAASDTPWSTISSDYGSLVARRMAPYQTLCLGEQS